MKSQEQPALSLGEGHQCSLCSRNIDGHRSCRQCPVSAQSSGQTVPRTIRVEQALAAGQDTGVLKSCCRRCCACGRGQQGRTHQGCVQLLLRKTLLWVVVLVVAACQGREHSKCCWGQWCLSLGQMWAAVGWGPCGDLWGGRRPGALHRVSLQGSTGASCHVELPGQVSPFSGSNF